jgi:hypothetical protein
MSDLDLFSEEPTEILFRAALPGRPSRLVRPPDPGRGGSGRPDGGTLLFAPGRAALEAAVLLAALAILVPLCAPPALACALVARRRDNPRWLAALVAAAWCGLLGVVVRLALGVAVAP